MALMFHELGKRLSVKEVASYFGVDVRFVRRHYALLGGVRLSNRVYVFFEKEIIRAIQRQIEQQQTMDRSSADQWPEAETPLRDEKRGFGMGNPDEAKLLTKAEKDAHGIFA